MIEDVQKLLNRIIENHYKTEKIFLFHFFHKKSEILTTALDQIKTLIFALQKETRELELSSLENLYSLEGYRKYFFSNILLLQLKISAVGSNIKKCLANENIVKFKIFEKNDLSLDLIEDFFCDEENFFSCNEYLNLLFGQMNLFTELKQKNIPVYENDSFSMIAYSLSSFEYYEQVVFPLQEYSNIEESLESEIFDEKDFKFVFKDSLYDHDAYNSHCFKQEIHKVFGVFFEFKVVAYFSKHFHCLISSICGDFSKFVQSISKSQENFLKKKKISLNGKFLLQSVSETVFKKFLDFLPNYLRHQNKVIFHKMPSRMLRIIGAYRVSVKSSGKKRKE